MTPATPDTPDPAGHLWRRTRNRTPSNDEVLDRAVSLYWRRRSTPHGEQHNGEDSHQDHTNPTSRSRPGDPAPCPTTTPGHAT